MKKILLTGRTGQVGYELERSLQGRGQIIALDRSQLDLSNLAQVRNVIREVKPDLIVNPAAYTAVDKAEAEPALAMLVNAEAPAVMAEEARKLGAAMIHYSTDYVFDGTKETPYLETDPTCPINVYGLSKLRGEQAIQAAGIPYLIFRTSWVYGMRGKNFLATIMRLAEERDELRIVADQVGAPTWCRTIADTTAQIITQLDHGADRTQGTTDAWTTLSGVYHLTGQDRTSWHGFTRAILEHHSINSNPAVIPITTAEFPLPAMRPANSTLDCGRLIAQFCELPKWDDALRLCQD
jgi:dTDP-4-dehydrorhamnose reductase